MKANATYQLLTTGKTLLQGLLEPEDVQACFGILEARIPLGEIAGLVTLDTASLNVQCDSCLNASH